MKNEAALDQELIQAISGRPDGAPADELAQLVGKAVTRRTLQRHLARLAAAGRILVAGGGRTTRYRPVPAAEPLSQDEMSISTTAASLRAYVRQPLHRRQPVGYDATLLEAYVPNQTAYLPDELRHHLHETGRRQEHVRPAGTYARAILERLLIDLSWASSRLEGNTYSLLDTRELLRSGRAAEGRDALETQMIVNHKAAIEMLVDGAERIGFDPFTFRSLHALLSDNLLADPNARGRLRLRPVEISGSVFIPLAVPSLIDEHFRSLLAKAHVVDDPFEQAFLVMVHIPYLQPFEDVNKRVSRLGANIPFIKKNLSPLSFVDVPERDYVESTLALYETGRFEALRDVFVWAYERSARRYGVIKESMAEPDPFRLLYRQALREVVAAVVRGRMAPTMAVVESLVPTGVAAEDKARFVAMVEGELAHLDEGNIALYGLWPEDLEGWGARPANSVMNPPRTERGRLTDRR